MERRSLPPDISGSYSYIDTVGIRMPKLMENEQFKEFQREMRIAQGNRRRCIHLAKHHLPVEAGGGWFFVMYVHQPTPEALKTIDRENYHVLEVAVALDLVSATYPDTDELREYIDLRLQKNARPVKLTTWIEDQTSYTGRTNSRRSSYYATYSDKLSKILKEPCVHIEYRIIGSSALKNRRLKRGSDICALNHRQFWDTQLRMRKAPSEAKLTKARVRLMRRRGDSARKIADVGRTIRAIFRGASGPHGGVLSSDLLHTLRQNVNIAGKNPGRLFTPESHGWMLPGPKNSLWDGRDGESVAIRATKAEPVAQVTRRRKVQGQIWRASPTKTLLRKVELLNDDDDSCLAQLLLLKYGEAPICPGCGVVPAHFHKISKRRGYVCQDCGRHVYPCVGTPFEGSKLPLSKWFLAANLLLNDEHITARSLELALGVEYKTAWRMKNALVPWIRQSQSSDRVAH
ncbi:hypothetical protein BH11PSE7_BH11PSE7_20120 [soil metagenome]